jgi:hypothetical protein
LIERSPAAEAAMRAHDIGKQFIHAVFPGRLATWLGPLQPKIRQEPPESEFTVVKRC